MYAFNDYEALLTSPFPIAEIYRQATGTSAGAIGLLAIIFLSLFLGLISVYITVGRTLWALSRDGATPFPNVLNRVHRKLGVPVNATITCACLVTILGCVYIGSTEAFNTFASSFILMSTASYTAAILPNIATRRINIIYGPFELKGIWGYVVNIIVCAYMIIWFVIYCFPYSLPTAAENINYVSLLWGGLTMIVGCWWFFKASQGYKGPETVGGIRD